MLWQCLSRRNRGKLPGYQQSKVLQQPRWTQEPMEICDRVDKGVEECVAFDSSCIRAHKQEKGLLEVWEVDNTSAVKKNKEKYTVKEGKKVYWLGKQFNLPQEKKMERRNITV